MLRKIIIFFNQANNWLKLPRFLPLQFLIILWVSY